MAFEWFWEEIGDVLQTAFRVVGCHFGRVLVATKVVGKRNRLINLGSGFSDSIPRLFQILRNASHFEIVNVHAEHAFEFPMYEEAFPSRDGDESGLLEFDLAMSFPKHSSHGVSIQGQSERAHRIKFWIFSLAVFPGLRPVLEG